MRAIQEICEAHNQPPSWWDTLTAEDRALLLGRRNYTLRKQARDQKAADRKARRNRRR